MNKNKKYFLIYVVNILLGLLYISPLIWMVVSAFKPENRIFADMSKGLAAFWPAGATLDNFKEVFVRSNMPRLYPEQCYLCYDPCVFKHGSKLCLWLCIQN